MNSFYETQYDVVYYQGDVESVYPCTETHTLDDQGTVTVEKTYIDDNMDNELQDFDSLDAYDLDDYATRYPHAYQVLLLDTACKASRTEAIRAQLSPNT